MAMTPAAWHAMNFANYLKRVKPQARPMIEDDWPFRERQDPTELRATPAEIAEASQKHRTDFIDFVARDAAREGWFKNCVLVDGEPRGLTDTLLKTLERIKCGTSRGIAYQFVIEPGTPKDRQKSLINAVERALYRLRRGGKISATIFPDNTRFALYLYHANDYTPTPGDFKRAMEERRGH